MIEIKITKDMLSKAKNSAKEMGTLRNSITKGHGNIAGFLGEELLLAAYPQIQRNNTYEHDMIIGDYSIEVKCKRQSALNPPPLHYEASITDYNPNQKTNVYFFCRVSNCYKKGWIIGWIRKSEYFKMAKFHRKGDLDPSNNFIFKCDCYNLPYSALNKPPPGNQNVL